VPSAYLYVSAFDTNAAYNRGPLTLAPTDHPSFTVLYHSREFCGFSTQ